MTKAGGLYVGCGERSRIREEVRDQNPRLVGSRGPRRLDLGPSHPHRDRRHSSSFTLPRSHTATRSRLSSPNQGEHHEFQSPVSRITARSPKSFEEPCRWDQRRQPRHCAESPPGLDQGQKGGDQEGQDRLVPGDHARHLRSLLAGRPRRAPCVSRRKPGYCGWPSRPPRPWPWRPCCSSPSHPRAGGRVLEAVPRGRRVRIRHSRRQPPRLDAAFRRRARLKRELRPSPSSRSPTARPRPTRRRSSPGAGSSPEINLGDRPDPAAPGDDVLRTRKGSSPFTSRPRSPTRARRSPAPALTSVIPRDQ